MDNLQKPININPSFNDNVSPDVIRLMKEYEVSREVAQKAWQLCCDRNVLENFGVECNLWDGKHEHERLVFEKEIIEEAKLLFS